MMHNNKVALITGSTHGIGAAIAIELAKLGISVIINGASTKELPINLKKEFEQIFGENYLNHVLFIRADISLRKDRNYLIESIKNKFGRIDILINNAGVAPKKRVDILETSEESYDWVMGVNLRGPFFLTQSISKWMLELRNQISGYNPYIINISSISRYAVSINRSEYCLSKAAMSMMTKLYAVKLAEYNIPVFEISPGIIETPMTEKVKEKYDKLINEGLTPIKRWGKPMDIAKTVVAIVKGLIPYSTGSVLEIDGGFHIHRL
ncbi:MAG: 3-ketoacyl-ACP reductase [Promethearchaeota archaeon]